MEFPPRMHEEEQNQGLRGKMKQWKYALGVWLGMLLAFAAIQCVKENPTEYPRSEARK